ncbi:hypothetical protein L2E82_22242 [Cichorium intybus]|uniref:Uncharacterized protein n=1 Tax=Cichorium intybus TaxID=13427 RepID=A0ACB9DXQ6_CICIN|nr:hypothetical protein L2E82_22242 [Cichorium intybus]
MENGWRARAQEDEDIKKIATTFFVGNLPANCTTSMIWRDLMKYGKIVDVYMPEKRERSGGVFAFVRFIRIHKVKEMEDTLNNVMIGGRKLKANIAKYARLQRPETVMDVGRRKEPGNAKEKEVKVRSNGMSIGRSFKDVVNNSGVKSGEMVETKRAKIVIPEAVNLGGPAWVDNCLIGEVIDIELLSNFFSIFHNSGIAECSIKYAGGLLVILKFESKEISSAFLTDQRDTWSRCEIEEGEFVDSEDDDLESPEMLHVTEKVQQPIIKTVVLSSAENFEAPAQATATAPAKQSAKNIGVIEESSIDHLKVVDVPLQGVSCACACAREQTKNGDLHVFEEPLKSISCARDNNNNSDTFSCANTNQVAGDTFSCARDNINNSDTFSCANTNQDAGSGSSKLYWAMMLGLEVKEVLKVVVGQLVLLEY